MKPILSKRAAELASILLCAAMIIGIGIPIYTKMIRKAGSVVAEHNLSSARGVIDAAIITSDVSWNDLNASSLTVLEPKIKWLDFKVGDTLPQFEELTSEQKNSVLVVRGPGTREMTVFVITLDRKILYSRGVDGMWIDEGETSFDEGIEGVSVTGKSAN